MLWAKSTLKGLWKAQQMCWYSPDSQIAMGICRGKKGKQQVVVKDFIKTLSASFYSSYLWMHYPNIVLIQNWENGHIPKVNLS